MARASVPVVVDRWVRPYLELMARMPGGPKATAAVGAFVSRHGVRVGPGS